jgi:CDP-paratose 2-epimerase
MNKKLGVCQWFHYKAYQDVENAVRLMRELGIQRIRTGISWADFFRPNGRQWYDWQMAALSEFDVLLSIWHTPPSISEGNSCASPPRRLQDYADFIDLVIREYGHLFESLELWNEPNNRLKWDFPRFDPQWQKFAEMITMAGSWARHSQKPTVLGGMIPVDHHWLNLMNSYGVLDHIDVVAIHGFPGMWWPDRPNWDWYSHWLGWKNKIKYIQEHSGDRPIWVTETGFATNVDHSGLHTTPHDTQADMLQEAAEAPADCVYWYSLIDLDPAREAIEGFHVDEHEYHLGLVTYDGQKKPAWNKVKELLESN